MRDVDHSGAIGRSLRLCSMVVRTFGWSDLWRNKRREIESNQCQVDSAGSRHQRWSASPGWDGRSTEIWADGVGRIHARPNCYSCWEIAYVHSGTCQLCFVTVETKEPRHHWRGSTWTPWRRRIRDCNRWWRAGDINAGYRADKVTFQFWEGSKMQRWHRRHLAMPTEFKMQFWQFLVLLLVMCQQGLQYRWHMKSGTYSSTFSGAPETEVKMNVRLHIENMWMTCMDSWVALEMFFEENLMESQTQAAENYVNRWQHKEAVLIVLRRSAKNFHVHPCQGWHAQTEMQSAVESILHSHENQVRMFYFRGLIGTKRLRIARRSFTESNREVFRLVKPSASWFSSRGLHRRVNCRCEVLVGGMRLACLVRYAGESDEWNIGGKQMIWIRMRAQHPWHSKFHQFLQRTVCEPSVAVHLFWVVSHSFELVIFELPGIRVWVLVWGVWFLCLISRRPCIFTPGFQRHALVWTLASRLFSAVALAQGSKGFLWGLLRCDWREEAIACFVSWVSLVWFASSWFPKGRYGLKRIPHASDPGSKLGCHTRWTGRPLPHPWS